MKTRCLLIVLMCLTACSRQKSPPTGPAPAVAQVALAAGSDRDLEAVRAWLRENTSDGNWEEVRWWPGRDMVEWKARHVKIADESLAYRADKTSPTYSRQKHDEAIRETHDVKMTPPIRICRLKWRAKNALGATSLSDVYFLIAENKANPWSNEGMPIDFRTDRPHADYKISKYFPE